MEFYAVFICVLIINAASAAYEDARCKCVCLLPSSYMNNTKSSKKIYVKAIPSEKCTCEYMLQNDKDLCRYCECKFQVRNTATIKVVVCLILTVITALVLYMLFLLLLEPLLSTRHLSHKTIIDMGICSEPQQPNNFTINQHNNNDKINDARSTNSWVNINIPVSSSSHGDSAVYSKAIDKAVIWDKTKLTPKQFMDSNLRIITAPSNRWRLRNRSGLISNDQVEDPNGLNLTTIPSTSVGVSSVVNRVRDQQQRWKGNVEAQRTRVFSERSLLN